MNEEILNRLASLEVRISNLELKLMDTNKSNPGLLHEEVVKFLQTFGSELNRMYGAYGPNQMAMNIQPGGMFQQPIYGSSPNGNATMYKPNCRFSGNGFNNYYQPPFNPYNPNTSFKPSYSATDAFKEQQAVQEEQAISNNNYCSNSEAYDVRKIKLEDWDKRIEKLGIKITRPTSADNTFLIIDSKYYRDITTRDSNYPNKNLRDGYAWYPELLMDPKTKTYLWSIARIIPTDKE